MTKAQGSFNRNKKQCPQGHEYTEKNTYTNPQGRRWCRTCARANGRVQTFKKYGLTPDQVTLMLILQQFKCAICERPLAIDPEFDGPDIKLREIQIDHNHDCCGSNKGCENCVRGLLCGECNRGLSRFKDRADLLRRAADYLDMYSSASTN